MIFLSGSTFTTADVMTVGCTPTNQRNETIIKLSNAQFDDLYLSDAFDKNGDLIPVSETIPTSWNFETVLHAMFDGSTMAGNINWSLNTTDYIIIKRKRVEDFNWITIKVKPIEDYNDFNVSGVDLTATTGQYMYAIVPIVNETIEGVYSTLDEPLDVEVTKLVILDEDSVYSTPIIDSDCSTTSIMPSSTVELLNGKFPYIVRNTRANYEQVQVTASFFPNKDGEEYSCIDINASKNLVARWNREFKAWLTNGKIKLLKKSDGDMWLGYITQPPTSESEQGSTIIRQSFGLTETGLPIKEEDLWNAGLLDESVTQSWWNN